LNVAPAKLAPFEDRMNGNLDNQEVRKKILVRLSDTCDQQKGIMALNRIHGLLSSTQGSDAQVFSIYENGKRVQVGFPKLGIRIWSEAVERVRRFSSVELVIVAVLNENSQ
jgi:hypothetical protein